MFVRGEDCLGGFFFERKGEEGGCVFEDGESEEGLGKS